MPRPKIVRTKEEASRVDPSLPVQVEVTDNPAVDVPVLSTNGKDGGGASVTTSPPPPSALPPRDDTELTSLRTQIETMKKNQEDAARQIAEAQRREADLRRQYDEQHRAARTSQDRAFQAEVDAVNNGIATFESELASAKAAMRIAAQAGDWETHAEASERIGAASWNLAQYKDAKTRLDRQGEQIKTQQQYYQQQPMSIEAQIDQMPISHAQKTWFKKHPDVLQDDYKRSKVTVAHFDAVNKGLTPDSPAYFDAVEVAMGYKEPPPMQEPEDDGIPSPLPQSVSAPVSRESVSASTGRPTTTRITLTAAQREAARDAGVDEITYARGLLELEKRKQSGMYQNG